MINYLFNNLNSYRKGNFHDQKYHDLIYSLNLKRNFLIGDNFVEGIIKEVDLSGNLVVSVSGKKRIFKEKEISYLF